MKQYMNTDKYLSVMQCLLVTFGCSNVKYVRNSTMFNSTHMALLKMHPDSQDTNIIGGAP